MACTVLPTSVAVPVGVGVVSSDSADVEAGEPKSTPRIHAGKVMVESPLILLLPAGSSRLKRLQGPSDVVSTVIVTDGAAYLGQQ